jgi:tRNA threonylcarbamoyladenosine biosynthesis protein TsaE
LSDPEELEFLGFRDYLASGAIVLIEWPSRGEGWLPNPDLKIELSENGSGRVLRVLALTTNGSQVLKRCGVDHVA